MGVSQIPHADHRVGLEGCGGDKFGGLHIESVQKSDLTKKRCLTFVGSQETALTALRPMLFRVKLSFLVLTSQTVTKPALLPVTRMWATFLFQSKHSMSSVRAAELPSRDGLSRSFRSEMNSYQLLV